jgi:peptidoglycan hydrolase CwlO-like protein
MPMRRIVMMVMAGCMIGMLTGCGVPKEEHEAKLAELNAAWAEIETLKGKVADTESLLKVEQGKVRNSQIEMDDATKQVTELKEKEAATARALTAEKGKVAALENDIAAAKSATQMANDRISELEAALAKLQEEYDNLQNRFDQLKKNMLSLGGEIVAPAPEPMAVEAVEASATDDESSATAKGLLDDMSTL